MKKRTAEHSRKLGEAVNRLWKDPAYRQRLIEKQKQLGYRNYPVKTTTQ